MEDEKMTFELTNSEANIWALLSSVMTLPRRLQQTASIVVMAIGLTVAFNTEAATTISGLVQMATDASGNYSGGNRWNTIGGDSIVTMYVIGSSNLSD